MIHVRWMIRRDMPEVINICNDTDEYLTSLLRQRDCIGMVAEIGERIVGMMVYELHKQELLIIRCVVHPSYRRQGIGRLMMSKLTAKLSPSRRTKMKFIVSEHSFGGLQFLKKLGFKATKVLRNQFSDWEDSWDGYLMKYSLPRMECV